MPQEYDVWFGTIEGEAINWRLPRFDDDTPDDDDERPMEGSARALLGFDPTSFGVGDKYNPAQPRDPEGVPTGGQWSSTVSIRGNMSRIRGDQDQPVADLDELYRLAQEEREAFLKELQDFATEMDGEVTVAPHNVLKSKESAQRKLTAELDGDVTKLRDVLRGTIVNDTVEQARRSAAEFIKRMGPRITRMKDRIVADLDGYRDLLVNYRTKDNGIIGELQFNSRNMIAAKMGDGHKIYERMRTLPKDGRNALELMAMKSESKALYERAYKNDGNGDWR